MTSSAREGGAPESLRRASDSSSGTGGTAGRPWQDFRFGQGEGGLLIGLGGTDAPDDREVPTLTS